MTLAIEMFDTDGFDVEIMNTRLEEIIQDGKTTRGYSAVVRVSVYSSDGRCFYRDGLGFNELASTNSGVALIDAAIKGAVSNAILRALVLLGDAFGLFLYSEKKVLNFTHAVQTSGSNDVIKKDAKSALSDKQQQALRNKGFTQGHLNQIATMHWQQRKELMDGVLGKGLAVNDAVAKYNLAGGEDDGYPF